MSSEDDVRGAAADGDAIAARRRERSRSPATWRSCSARPEDDLAHPAFGKLFVETEFDPQSAGLLFSRRPRASDESPLVALPRARGGRPAPGRGGGVGDRPRALHRPRAHAGQSHRARWPRVCPERRARCSTRLARCASGSGSHPAPACASSFATGVAPDRPAALALARKYRDGSAAARAFSMAFTHVHITLQHLGHQRRAGDAVRSAGVARLRIGHVVHQPGRSRRQHASASRICGGRASPAIRPSCCCACPSRRRFRSRGSCSTRRNTGASRACAPRSSSSTSTRPTTSTRCRTCSPSSCSSRPGPAGSANPVASSCSAAMEWRKPIAGCSRPSRASCCRAIWEISCQQLERPAPWLYDHARRALCRGAALAGAAPMPRCRSR